jgi:hypothetical protein
MPQIFSIILIIIAMSLFVIWIRLDYISENFNKYRIQTTESEQKLYKDLVNPYKLITNHFDLQVNPLIMKRTFGSIIRGMKQNGKRPDIILLEVPEKYIDNIHQYVVNSTRISGMHEKIYVDIKILENILDMNLYQKEKKL